MKNLFKQAHKMAKEIKTQYPDVSYSFQFSLCLKHIQTIKELTVEEQIKVAAENVISKIKASCPAGKEERLTKLLKYAQYVETKLIEQAPAFAIVESTVKGMISTAIISGKSFSQDETIRTIAYMVRDEF
jgi:hypothetical protein